VSLSVAFSVCRGEYDVMRNSRVLIGKPAVGHATNERVLLIGKPDRRITSWPCGQSDRNNRPNT